MHSRQSLGTSNEVIGKKFLREAGASMQCIPGRALERAVQAEPWNEQEIFERSGSFMQCASDLSLCD